MSNTDKFELKPEVQKVSDAVQKAIKFDENGVPSIDDGFYASMLTGDMNIEIANELAAQNTTINAGVADGFGRLGIDYLEKNPTVDRVELVMPTAGKDNVSFTLSRSGTTNNPQTKEPMTVYGQMRIAAENHSVKNAGQLGKVKKNLAAMAMARFASK